MAMLTSANSRAVSARWRSASVGHRGRDLEPRPRPAGSCLRPGPEIERRELGRVGDGGVAQQLLLGERSGVVEARERRRPRADVGDSVEYSTIRARFRRADSRWRRAPGSGAEHPTGSSGRSPSGLADEPAGCVSRAADPVIHARHEHLEPDVLTPVFPAVTRGPEPSARSGRAGLVVELRTRFGWGREGTGRTGRCGPPRRPPRPDDRAPGPRSAAPARAGGRSG